MIVSCDVNGCKTKWLRLPCGYLRLNWLNMKDDSCHGKSFWVSKRIWNAMRDPIPVPVRIDP